MKSNWIILIINSAGDIIAVGDETGEPLLSERIAQEFIDRYKINYPTINAVPIPILGSALDT